MLRLEQHYSESFLRLSEEEPSENMAAPHVFSSAAAHCQLWHRVGLRRQGDFSNSTWEHFYLRNSFGKCKKKKKKLQITFSLTPLLSFPHGQAEVYINREACTKQETSPTTHSKPASDNKSSLTSPTTRRRAWRCLAALPANKAWH